MKRISSLLALGAIVVAGAFAGTAAQASANVSANFNVQNADASKSMILISKSSNVSGLSGTAILPGNNDPASGAALFSDGALSVNQHDDGFVIYANASDSVSNKCTFNMRITRTAPNVYVLHFWVGSGTNCSVPNDASNSTGIFTSTTYGLVWKT